MDLLEFLFSLGRRPVRRVAEVLIRDDSDQVESVQGTAFLLSEEGSIDKISVVNQRFHTGCGCTTGVPVGGKCSRCSNIVCVNHLKLLMCGRCGTPLCARHSELKEVEGNPVRLCLVCSDVLWPKMLVSKIVGFLGEDKCE